MMSRPRSAVAVSTVDDVCAVAASVCPVSPVPDADTVSTLSVFNIIVSRLQQSVGKIYFVQSILSTSAPQILSDFMHYTKSLALLARQKNSFNL